MFPPQHRVKERDQVHDEADLGEQRQRKRDRQCQERGIAQGGGADARGGYFRHAVRGAGRRIAPGRPADEQQQHRDQQQHHGRGRHDHRTGKAELADRTDQQRHADDAAATGAVQRQADRHAPPPVEPHTERIGDGAEAGAGPAAGEQHVDGIKLPHGMDLPQQDRRQPEAGHAGDQAVAGAEHPHRVADEGNQQGAGEIEHRGRGRNPRCRPAVNAAQLGEVDALAVEAEAPADGGDQEADRDDAPADIADRAFVDGVGIGGRHGVPDRLIAAAGRKGRAVAESLRRG